MILNTLTNFNLCDLFLKVLTLIPHELLVAILSIIELLNLVIPLLSQNYLL